MSVVETKMLTQTKKGTWIKSAVTLDYRDGRIYFVKSPFALKDQIKAMAGARWMGFEDPPQKMWAVKDCQRNRMQIAWLEGENVYEWFERPLVEHVSPGLTRFHLGKDRDENVWKQQLLMINSVLTYHYQLLAACMGAGKTLSAIEIMERSGVSEWWFVAPKTVCLELELQFRMWQLNSGINVKLMTYDKMASLVKDGAYDLPQGVFFDEGSKLKTFGVGRQAAAQELADKIREVHGYNGYVVVMSGTPSPKSPLDIWSLAEICWPGFLSEGSPKALERRIAVLKPSERPGEIGGYYNERVAWLDREGLCKTCGLPEGECQAMQDMDPMTAHQYQPSKNEVANIFERLRGLMVVIHKSDCQELPAKTFVEVNLPPSKKLLKVAAAVQRTATTTMQGLAQLRQLSDGFMYRETKDGEKTCPTCNSTGEIDEWFNPIEPDRPYQSIELMDPEKCKNFEKRRSQCCHCMGSGQIDNIIRETVDIPCPKTDIVEDLLEKAEEDTGRIMLFAGFVGSVDKLTRLCHAAGWEVFRCDGRGTMILGVDGRQVTKSNPLEYWSDMKNKRVAFVANPESGGFGLTLVEANIICFYSNSYKPEYRVQAIDRAHRPGQERPVKIYDLLHLPSDKRTLDILAENRKLEQMVLGDILGDCFTQGA